MICAKIAILLTNLKMINITKIIFFIEAHFNQRDYNRFGIPVLLENGFEVEVWDFTPFLTNARY